MVSYYNIIYYAILNIIFKMCIINNIYIFTLYICLEIYAYIYIYMYMYACM